MGVSHSWYDKPPWPYWQELRDAEEFIQEYVYKKSRCRLFSKEKWGTLRYERILPPAHFIPKWRYNGCGFTITTPWKSKYKWDKEPTRHVLFMWTSCWLYYKWMWWGDKMLGKAVKLAILKWPYLEKEITADLTWR